MMNTNVNLFKTMVDFYNTVSYTHQYIFGVMYKGNVYMVKADSDILAYVLMLDKAGRGNGHSLRFRPNNSIKVMLIALGAQILCSSEMFKQECANSKYNKGEVFEKMVTEYFGQEWHKDNVPFTDDGDITVDGIAWQIKYENATFINEKQMVRMGC